MYISRYLCQSCCNANMNNLKRLAKSLTGSTSSQSDNSADLLSEAELNRQIDRELQESLRGLTSRRAVRRTQNTLLTKIATLNLGRSDRNGVRDWINDPKQWPDLSTPAAQHAIGLSREASCASAWQDLEWFAQTVTQLRVRSPWSMLLRIMIDRSFQADCFIGRYAQILYTQPRGRAEHPAHDRTAFGISSWSRVSPMGRSRYSSRPHCESIGALHGDRARRLGKRLQPEMPVNYQESTCEGTLGEQVERLRTPGQRDVTHKEDQREYEADTRDSLD